MLGNVWEWNQDKWHGSYEGAPIDGSAWESGDSSSHLLRGCSWSNKPDNCRSAYRRNVDSPLSLNGFRVVSVVTR
jgi:formylglycine-generating enzyme required for sulfatase activity